MRSLVVATALVLGSAGVLGCASSPWAPLPPLPPPAPRPAPQAASPEAMQEVMGELTELGQLDPAAREGLMADLRDTDPKLWPQVVQQFKAAVAYRRQAEQREMLAKGVPGSKNAANPHTPGVATASGVANPGGVVATGYAQAAAPATAPTSAPTTQHAACEPSAQDLPQPATSVSAGPPFSALKEPPRAPSPTGKPPETTSAPASAPPQPAAPPLEPAPVKKAETPEKTSSASREASNDWQTPLTAAIGAMELTLQQGPEGAEALQRQSQLRLLCLVAGRRDDALKPLAVGTPIQREFWTKQVYGLDTWLDTARTPDAPRRAAETKRLLDEAAMRLGESAALGVRNLAFCTDIQSYGCYKVFKTDEFAPEQELLLYAEVENFTSEASAKGFHTSLRSSYQIFDSRGQRVADHDFTVTEEHCQNPRRDFFIGYHLRLPKRLNPGKYTLQLTIEDLKSQKVGQSSVDFTVRESVR